MMPVNTAIARAPTFGARVQIHVNREQEWPALCGVASEEAVLGRPDGNVARQHRTAPVPLHPSQIHTALATSIGA